MSFDLNNEDKSFHGSRRTRAFFIGIVYFTIILVFNIFQTLRGKPILDPMLYMGAYGILAGIYGIMTESPKIASVISENKYKTTMVSQSAVKTMTQTTEAVNKTSSDIMP